jgi:hypothetical protein
VINTEIVICDDFSPVEAYLNNETYQDVSKTGVGNKSAYKESVLDNVKQSNAFSLQRIVSN